jgi:hypothetical protein
MGTAMSPASASDQRAPKSRRRGRLQLMLVLLVALGPMILATSMYKFKFWVPDGRSFHGDLIATGETRTELGVQSDETRWQLLVTAPDQCEADCQQLVYLARQIQIGLGRDATRASHALTTTQPLDPAYDAKLTREYPQLQRYRWTSSAINARRPGSICRSCGSSIPTAISCCATAPRSTVRICSTTCANC